MDKRTVMRLALEWKDPPYVPWNINFTLAAREKLQAHYPGRDLEQVVQNHMLNIGYDTYFCEDIGNDCVRDVFGVIWDRSIDRDIGVVRGQVLDRPTLKGYAFPDPTAPYVFAQVEGQLKLYGDRFRIFGIGFSLYERAWSLRGLQTLLMDFYDHPDFVHDLLNQIADYNIAQIKAAVHYDIDAVMFGDDWGQQHGLQMGPRLWHEFIYPVLKRMYSVAIENNKKVIIHSCGDVDELFEELIGIGLNCFNPFQPEVMDVTALVKEYRGRLAFYGGLSTQKTLPYGSVEDVRHESAHLLELGRHGGYVFSPAHDIPRDVPLENILEILQAVQHQTGYQQLGRA